MTEKVPETRYEVVTPVPFPADADADAKKLTWLHVVLMVQHPEDGLVREMCRFSGSVTPDENFVHVIMDGLKGVAGMAATLSRMTCEELAQMADVYVVEREK
jgi:hypothetical protein